MHRKQNSKTRSTSHACAHLIWQIVQHIFIAQKVSTEIDILSKMIIIPIKPKLRQVQHKILLSSS
jgi:hypothetical protein